MCMRACVYVNVCVRVCVFVHQCEHVCVFVCVCVRASVVAVPASVVHQRALYPRPLNMTGSLSEPSPALQTKRIVN